MAWDTASRTLADERPRLARTAMVRTSLARRGTAALVAGGRRLAASRTTALGPRRASIHMADRRLHGRRVPLDRRRADDRLHPGRHRRRLDRCPAARPDPGDCRT